MSVDTSVDKGADTKLLAWLGGKFFMRHMEAQGYRLAHIPLTSPQALTWEDICARCGAAPDAVVYADRSLPPPLLGLERYPALTAFYCIDSHIHGWYPLYAGAFDLCAVSLKGDLERFDAGRAPGRVLWLPPFAEERYLSAQPDPPALADQPAHSDQPDQADKDIKGGTGENHQQHDQPAQLDTDGMGGQAHAHVATGTDFDLLFVGTVDPDTTPQRHDFLRRLGRVFPGLATRQGDFTELLPRARVALNIAERGDLNFRVFEALACGACLLTPKIANGQDELFEDGVHFVTYRPDDEADAAAKARALLADDLLDGGVRRKAVGRAGFARVNALHRPWHRAEALAALLRQGFDEGLPAQRLASPDRALGAALRLLYLHWAEHCGDPALAARYLAEARRLPHPAA